MILITSDDTEKITSDSGQRLKRFPVVKVIFFSDQKPKPRSQISENPPKISPIKYHYLTKLRERAEDQQSEIKPM